MRALDRLPRRRTPPMIQRLAALVVSFVVLFAVATAFSPSADADPTPGHLGGWTETDPFHGEAASPFTITYWFIPIEGACPFTHARFIWDNVSQIGTAPMNATCSATLPVSSAPTSVVQNHPVNAEGCTMPGGVLTCDASTNAGTMYMVDPTPTIVVTPTRGAPGDPLSVTYTVPDPSCFYTHTQFYWDGEVIGSPVPMTDCSSTLPLDEVPEPYTPGGHTVEAEACDGGSCEPTTRKSTTYTVVIPPPELTVNPSDGLANQNFGLRYTVFDEPCPYTSAQFYWDGSPLGPPVALDAFCSAPWFEDVAPTPDDVGSHTVAAEGCGAVTCDPTSRATATYTVLAPPTLVVAPTSGQVGVGFSATYQIQGGCDALWEVGFFWDDEPAGPNVNFDPDTCTAVFDFPSAPAPNDLGAHTVSAETCIDSCDDRTTASATYTVVPPPPPKLTADPTSGLPTVPITVTYDFGQTPCAFGWIEFAWDGLPLENVDVDSGCTATLSLTSAPDPATLGVHVLTGLPCGSTFCDSASLATTTYTIVAPPADPAFSVGPTEGLAGQPLGLHFSTNQTPCPYTAAQFFWDGAPIEAPVTLDASCSTVLFLDVAPAPDGIGVHTVAAEACTGTCDASTRAGATYEILAAPTLVVEPAAGLVGAAFTATYHINDSGCSLWVASFEWDGVVVAANVDLSTCTAVFTFPAAPVPNGVGSHTVSAVTCIDGCDPLTRASVVYAVAPPADPTIALDATSGLATEPFEARFSTNQSPCPYASAQFFWDGALVGAAIALDATCSAVGAFGEAPLPNDAGSHQVSAQACTSTCDPGTLVASTYRILARPPLPPSLTLSRANGRVGDPFRLTYATNATTTCAYTHAFFTWDGTVIGGAVGLDGSCNALLDLPGAPAPAPGSHALTAIACEGSSCDPATLARATYVVTAPRVVPTPTPRPTPTRTPTPTSTPRPTPRPTPSPEPSSEPTPSTEPSIEPGPLEPTPDPNPSPTGEVSVETNRPEPTQSPIAIVVVPSPSPSGNPFVPALASFVGGPGPLDPAVVGTNLLLTLLIVFLFGLTAEVFNSTMDANRSIVHGWWLRLITGPLAFVYSINFTGAGLSHLSGTSRFGSIARVLTILGLSGLIYGFLSPDFGMNPQSLVLFISLVIGLGFITFYSEGSASRLAKRRFSADSSIKLYGTAVIVAILAVIISRSMTFQPGLVYGFIASAVIIAPVALAKRDDATLILIPAFGLLVVSVFAWLLLAPVRVLAESGAPLPALGETILAMVVIGGLEGLFITMIPLRFLDGSTVKSWSFVAWALVFATVTFLWWQLLFNQNAAYVAALEQTNVQVVLFTLGAFMLTTGSIWTYFRFRPSPAEEPESEAVTAGEVTAETSAETAREA